MYICCEEEYAQNLHESREEMKAERPAENLSDQLHEHDVHKNSTKMIVLPIGS